MKKSVYIGAIVIIIGTLIIFFNMDNPSEDKLTKQNKFEEDWLPKVETSGEEILYYRLNQNIVAYDKNKKIITQWNDLSSIIQYEFNTINDLYTSGHSLKNEFKILEIKDGNYKILYNLNENEAVFPLASKDEYNIFIHGYYGPDGNELIDKRTITLFNKKENKLYDYKNTGGLISYGTFYEDRLYYTVFKEDSQDYELYSLDFTNFNSYPLLVEKGLKDGKLFVSDEGLWKCDDSYVFCNGKKFLKAKLNYIDQATDNLIQIDIEDGDICMRVINIQSEDEYLFFKNVVDFKINEKTITVYGEGYIKTGKLL